MKLATIGTGFIVHQFIDACIKVGDIEIFAVYSRSDETGRKLAERYKIPNVITDFDELIVHPEINTIYVASPNSLHYEQTKKILIAGKNAIVEKPFTSNVIETQELIKIALENNVYMFEAMSILHMPNLELLRHQVATISPVRWVEASMCQYSSKFDSFKKGEIPNVFNPDFSGGALMDLNIYHLYFFVDLFGRPDIIRYLPQVHSNGIDLSGLLYMEYKEFSISALASKVAMGRPTGTIHGEKGIIDFNEGINGLKSFTVTTNKESKTYNIQEETNRLYYQIKVFKETIVNQDKENMIRLLKITAEMMEMLTDIRIKSGVHFKNDIKFGS